MKPAPRRFPPRLRHLLSLLFVTPPGSDDGHDGCDNHYNDDGGDDDVPLHSSRGLYPCHSPQAKEHKGMCPDRPEHRGGNYNI